MASSLKHPWYSIHAKGAGPLAAAANAPKFAEVFIYGDIGESWYGDTIAAKDFVKEFAAIDADEITVRINSYGGSVTDGTAIYNAIKRHPASVTISIDGAAYSVASLIAMAADKREIADNAMLMIHAPWSLAVGNSADMRATADVLDKYAASMASSYMQASGQSHDAIMALLTDGQDHWYSAEEAKAAGFVTAIVNATAAAASFNASAAQRYRSAPSAIAALTAPRTTPAAPAVQTAAAAAPNAAAAANPSEKSMTQDEIKAAAEAKAIADAKLIAEAKAAGTADGIKAEAARTAGIKAAFAKFTGDKSVQDAEAACLADTNMSVEKANAKLLDVLGASGTSIAGGVKITTQSDETDKRRNAMSLALEIRAGLAKNDTANPYRGESLSELAGLCLAAHGVSAKGMSKMDRVGAAFTHSSGDFPLLLANVANKAMMKGWEEADETFQLWTNEGTAPDFKISNRASLNNFPDLDLVAPGGEYKYGTVGEHGATVAVSTYGKMFSINRAAIINDDMDAFSKVPRIMGRAAMRKIGNLVYAVLNNNAAFNGSALFLAGRNNLLASGTAISTTSVDAVMAAMALQTDGAAILNIRPKYLLCPISKRGVAAVVAASEFEVGASNKNNTTPNYVRGMFEVIADARLDAASAIAWYMVGDPTINDTIEVTYLDGQKTPVLEQQNGWTIDGVDFKVRMDAGVAPLDYRALYKNPGA